MRKYTIALDYEGQWHWMHLNGIGPDGFVPICTMKHGGIWQHIEWERTASEICSLQLSPFCQECRISLATVMLEAA